MTDKATSREKNDRGKNDRGHDERRKTVFYRQIFHPMSILLSLIVLIISKLQKYGLALGTSESTQAQDGF